MTPTSCAGSRRTGPTPSGILVTVAVNVHVGEDDPGYPINVGMRWEWLGASEHASAHG